MTVTPASTESPTHPGSIVIVGAGHGGANVAALLRQRGFAGSVTLIGDEPGSPYQRPPLSKDYLKGAMADVDLLIKPEDFYDTQHVTTRWGTRVAGLDVASRRVLLGSGEAVPYDALVLATGAAPRTLPAPGADLPGVHYLRTHADARRLGTALVPGKRLVIIGGGYVGLEVAASARHLGCEAVVLEREERALARVASVQLSDFLTARHAEQGTSVITGADVVSLRAGPDGSVGSVLLADGSEIACDVVLVGVGAVPRTELAVAAGLACEQGVCVDDRGRTSVAGVYAVGDATRRPLHHFAGAHRLESIPSAVEQAKQVACDLLGLPAPQQEVPWFWSDQYDLRIKIAGMIGTATHSVVRGGDDRRLVVFHVDGDRVVAAETVSSVPDFMIAKKLIASGASVCLERLADPSVPLKELAA
ncbi:FAD-dependent oxidoreductase [soil metagenome]